MLALPRCRGVLLLVALAAACSGGGNGPTTPSGPPVSPHRITITASGISPGELVVPPGARVLIVNSDTRRHDIKSDGHPEHDDCPELNQVGVLQPGQSRETGNLVAPGACGYHDDDSPGSPVFRGTIVIR